MFGIAPAELAADLRIQISPETGQIGGDLHRALIGREQVDDEWDRSAGHRRGFTQAEKVLQPRGYRGRAVFVILDAGAASTCQAKVGWRYFVYLAHRKFRLDRRQQPGTAQFGKAGEPGAHFTQGGTEQIFRKLESAVPCGESSST